MIANSMTVHSHPVDLVTYMEELNKKGIAIINSAVFNAGFLIGSDHYNYRQMDRERHPQLFKWRDEFFAVCDKFNVKPAEVCAAFGLHAPGVKSIALNTTNPAMVKGNIDMADINVPVALWDEMRSAGLIRKDYAHI